MHCCVGLISKKFREISWKTHPWLSLKVLTFKVLHHKLFLSLFRNLRISHIPDNH